MLKLLLVTLIVIKGIACQQNFLKEWFEQVGSVPFECETPSDLNEDDLKNQVPVVQIVDCDNPNATLNYEFKVS